MRRKYFAPKEVKSLQLANWAVYNLQHGDVQKDGHPQTNLRARRRRMTKGGRGMTSAMMMERTGMGMPGVGVPGMGTPGVVTPTTAHYLTVPRCTLRFEKCTGGMKVTCSCDDKMACSMVQNLCTMLTGGMCSCYAVFNGMTVCCYNFTMGLCRCEMTDSGVCLTCTSGDSKCCEMIQAACDCLSCMCNAGCTCCMLLNNTPVCCGCSETYMGSTSKTSGKR
jgi:hypothetical protein